MCFNTSNVSLLCVYKCVGKLLVLITRNVPFEFGSMHYLASREFEAPNSVDQSRVMLGPVLLAAKSFVRANELSQGRTRAIGEVEGGAGVARTVRKKEGCCVG